VSQRRSLLFVPGNNARMLRKAISSAIKADCLVFDLEDSVPVNQKENARKTILEVLLEQDQKKQVYVRINQLDSPLSNLDIAAFASTDAIENFVVPKADEKMINGFFRRTGKKIIPIVESPRGFIRMEEIAATKGVDALAYGAADMALSMKGSVESFETNDYIRTRVAIVARSFGLDPIDQVYFDLRNSEGFRRDAMKAKNLGYSGKLLIHPSQVEIANEVFSSGSHEELIWARKVVAAYEASLREGAKGAIRLDGQLVDAVHYKLAKELIAKTSA
jgi:citrate lyase subunit beta / citryl-CoA lyase